LFPGKNALVRGGNAATPEEKKKVVGKEKKFTDSFLEKKKVLYGRAQFETEAAMGGWRNEALKGERGIPDFVAEEGSFVRVEKEEKRGQSFPSFSMRLRKIGFEKKKKGEGDTVSYIWALQQECRGKKRISSRSLGDKLKKGRPKLTKNQARFALHHRLKRKTCPSEGGKNRKQPGKSTSIPMSERSWECEKRKVSN